MFNNLYLSVAVLTCFGTDVIPLDLTQLPATSRGSDASFSKLAQGTDFLGRLQLCSKSSYNIRGVIKPGHWGIPISADDIEDLGDSIDVLPLARKAKAVDMSDKDAILTNYDSDSAEFNRIAEKSLTEKDSKCMFGPSFLVLERSTGRMLELFCGSKSTRTEAGKIYPFLPLTQADIDAKRANGEDVPENIQPHGPIAITLNTKEVRKGTYIWHVPVVTKCSTPFNPKVGGDVIVREIVKFLTVKDGVERVEENGKKQRAR
jgi:hypothetical protein